MKFVRYKKLYFTCFFKYKIRGDHSMSVASLEMGANFLFRSLMAHFWWKLKRTLLYSIDTLPQQRPFILCMIPQLNMLRNLQIKKYIWNSIMGNSQIMLQLSEFLEIRCLYPLLCSQFLQSFVRPVNLRKTCQKHGEYSKNIYIYLKNYLKDISVGSFEN